MEFSLENATERYEFPCDTEFNSTIKLINKVKRK